MGNKSYGSVYKQTVLESETQRMVQFGIRTGQWKRLSSKYLTLCKCYNQLQKDLRDCNLFGWKRCFFDCAEFMPIPCPEWKSSKVLFNTCNDKKTLEWRKNPILYKKKLSQKHTECVIIWEQIILANVLVLEALISFWTHPASRPTTTSTTAN